MILVGLGFAIHLFFKVTRPGNSEVTGLRVKLSRGTTSLATQR